PRGAARARDGLSLPPAAPRGGRARRPGRAAHLEPRRRHQAAPDSVQTAEELTSSPVPGDSARLRLIEPTLEARAESPSAAAARMTCMDRYLLISADCHAGPRAEDARGYVDPRHRAAFDAWLADGAAMLRRRAEHTGEAVYGEEALGDFAAEEKVAHGGIEGAWHSKRRLEELEADGIAAEVIFPGGSMQTVSPFGSGLMTYQYPQDAALWAEGCRAYN